MISNKHTMLKWFWHNAVRSTKRGKIRWRPWKLLVIFFLLECKSYLLTGKSVDCLYDDEPPTGPLGPLEFLQDYYL